MLIEYRISSEYWFDEKYLKVGQEIAEKLYCGNVLVMDAAVVQVSKPVRNSRHYDSAPVQPEDIK